MADLSSLTYDELIAVKNDTQDEREASRAEFRQRIGDITREIARRHTEARLRRKDAYEAAVRDGKSHDEAVEIATPAGEIA
jgi:hypothetical protein